jgi:hypothetical protein
MPWKIAHKTDLLTDQEITMARAVPNVMPDLIVSNLYDIYLSLTISICPLFHYKAILCSVSKLFRNVPLFKALAFSDLVVIFRET